MHLSPALVKDGADPGMNKALRDPVSRHRCALEWRVGEEDGFWHLDHRRDAVVANTNGVTNEGAYTL